MPDRMPAFFVGHGSPMNAIEDNRWSGALRDLSTLLLPRPRSVLVVSAHWFVEGTRVTSHPRPPTIHDFGGFPRALHEVEYRAPGDPDLARRVSSLAQPSPDHYLPILYVAAAVDERDEVSFPIKGFDWGSLSMRSVLFG